MFLGSISQQVLEQLIRTMTNLLLSNKREVVKSALGFFKVSEINVVNGKKELVEGNDSSTDIVEVSQRHLLRG